MITSGLSIPVPVADNSAAIAAARARILAEERRAERALAFASLPCAREDAIVRRAVEDFLLDCGERAYVESDRIEHLAWEHGEAAPTQETWDALCDDERRTLLDDYVESDCRTGLWEFNPWGPLIERNNPLVFQPRRYGLSIETDPRLAN